MSSLRANKLGFRALRAEFIHILLVKNIHRDEFFFLKIDSFEDNLAFLSLWVKFLNELNEVVLLRTVVDHGLQGFVVGGFVDLHVAFFMDALHSCVLSVVDYEHHDAGLID